MTTEGSSTLAVRDAVGVRLDREMFGVKERLATVDNLLLGLQEKADEAERIARNSESDEDHAVRDQLQDRLNELLVESTILTMKLKELRSPSELERRVTKALANQTSLRRLLAMSEATATAEAPVKTKKPNAADKGAPAIYLNDDGKFRIGMDARFKSDLVNSATGQITTEKPGASLQVFEVAEAERLIAAFDWTQFLTRKQEILAGDQAKKAEAAKVREEKARVRAEEKAAKDAAKAAAKATESANDTTDGKATTGGKTPSKTDQARAQREAAAAAAAAK